VTLLTRGIPLPRRDVIIRPGFAIRPKGPGCHACLHHDSSGAFHRARLIVVESNEVFPSPGVNEAAELVGIGSLCVDETGTGPGRVGNVARLEEDYAPWIICTFGIAGQGDRPQDVKQRTIVIGGAKGWIANRKIFRKTGSVSCSLDNRRP
jgi:hypothetical protein